MNIFTFILTLAIGTLLAVSTPAWSDGKEGKIADLTRKLGTVPLLTRYSWRKSMP